MAHFIKKVVNSCFTLRVASQPNVILCNEELETDFSEESKKIRKSIPKLKVTISEDYESDNLK